MTIRPEDYLYKLSKYVEKNLSKGYTIDAIEWSLIGQGHSRTAVNKAIILVHQNMALKMSKIEVPVKKEKIIVSESAKPRKKGFLAKLFGLK